MSVERMRPAAELSVVLQIGPQRARAEECLRSLIAQDAIDRMEILVFDYAAREATTIAGIEHPRVRYLAREHLEPFGLSRSAAVALAAGAVVAFIEDHCLAHPGWASAILTAHGQGWVGVGPEVHNGNPGAGISDAVHLINYSRWLPPAVAGETDLLVGHNSSYSRASLMDYGEELAVLLRCDTVLQWRLARDGHRMAVCPEVKISHVNEADLASLFTGSFLWNRMFAPTRAEVFGWSVFKRIAWIFGTPLIPLVRTIKLVRGVLTLRPQSFWDCLRAIPIALAAHTAAALGQLVGLAAGMGDTEVSFLRYEISRDRQAASDGRSASPT